MKILVCGGKGQLGIDSTAVLSSQHRVTSTDLDELDITDLPAIDRFLERHRPDLIVNCAAYTRVDDCEVEVDLAHRINAQGPANLAAAAHKSGAFLIHISTDYVFDGNKPLPAAYIEGDPPNPVSAYGRSKLAGEEAVQKATDRCIILRTAWLYGIGGPNFLKSILRLAIQEPTRKIRVVNDQFGSPTWSYRLAHQMAALVGKELRGVYHATAEGRCTWYDLADRFLKEMKITGRVVPCRTDEYPTPARRPKNAVLENRRLKSAGVLCMADWQEDLARFVTFHRNRLLAEATGADP